MKPEPGADDTVRIRPPLPRRRSRAPLVIAAILAVLLAGSGAGYLFWPHSAPPPVAVPPVAVQQAPAPVAPAPSATTPIPSAPSFAIETATEQKILDNVPTDLSVFRLADNPRVLVLDFASLRDQGRMLNRVAALVEKAGLPHDRVVSETELDAAISARGDTVETFYYGHDYAASSLARFFGLVDATHVELDRQEERLRALLMQEGWLAPGTTAAVITLPAVGSSSKMTRAARAAILRHELSHGEFFSDRAYADYVHRFWLTELTEAERAAFRGFLGREEYDTGIEELMFNEMQAYLMFTRDPQFFTAGQAGLSDVRLAELQARFLAGMPAGWLRDVLAGYGAR
jgi:hypothetical protein